MAIYLPGPIDAESTTNVQLAPLDYLRPGFFYHPPRNHIKGGHAGADGYRMVTARCPAREPTPNLTPSE